MTSESIQTRRYVARALVVFIGIVAAICPVPARAETFGQGMVRLCPNGPQIAQLTKQYNEAVAIVDQSRYKLAKSLSLELYRCSVAKIDLYDHDISQYLSAAYLFDSTKTNGDAIEVDPVVGSRLNDLAAATQFDDIRRLALKLKAAVKNEYTAAYDKVNGTPAPDSEATP